MNEQYLQELLLLSSAAANEARALLNSKSTAGEVVGVSSDLIAAMQAVIARHAANQGKTIQEVLATT